MKIAVIDRQTPFAAPGPAAPAERLCAGLREHGHDAALVRLPFRADPRTIVDQVLAVRLLTLEDVDRVIGLAFPAYHVRHPDRVVWALDGHGPLSDGLPNTPLGGRVRRAVLAAERSFLGEARRVHAPTPEAAERLRRDAGIDAEILRLPPALAWADVVDALTR